MAVGVAGCCSLMQSCVYRIQVKTLLSFLLNLCWLRLFAFVYCNWLVFLCFSPKLLYSKNAFLQLWKLFVAGKNISTSANLRNTIDFLEGFAILGPLSEDGQESNGLAKRMRDRVASCLLDFRRAATLFLKPDAPADSGRTVFLNWLPLIAQVDSSSNKSFEKDNTSNSKIWHDMIWHGWCDVNLKIHPFGSRNNKLKVVSVSVPFEVFSPELLPKRRLKLI